MNLTVTVAGTVDTFDRQGYAARLATVLSVAVEDIALQVTPASVRVLAIITPKSKAAADAAFATLQAATPTSLSSDLQLKVEALEEPSYGTRIVPATPPPPMHPVPAADDDLNKDPAGKGMLSTGALIGVAFAGAFGALYALGLVIWWRRTSQAKMRAQMEAAAHASMEVFEAYPSLKVADIKIDSESKSADVPEYL